MVGDLNAQAIRCHCLKRCSGSGVQGCLCGRVPISLILQAGSGDPAAASLPNPQDKYLSAHECNQRKISAQISETRLLKLSLSAVPSSARPAGLTTFRHWCT